MKNPSSTIAEKYLVLTPLAVTIIFLPITFDPINIPKLAFLTFGSFASLAIVISQIRHFDWKKFELLIILVVVFLIQLFLSFFVSGAGYASQFYGWQGRSSGLLAYFDLIGLLLVSAVFSSNELIQKLTKSILFTGLISIAYGLIQYMNLDPLKWVNSYSPVIGFLGNPDFQSSFVAFSAIVAFAFFISSGVGRLKRLLSFIYLLLAFIMIIGTKALQGIVLLALGFILLLIIFLSKNHKKFAAKVLIANSLIIAYFGVLGALNKGPLAGLLFKDSVIYRGDYWNAGWQMTISHPFFGIGIDNYGSWYRRARSLEATIRRGPDMVADASHNVLLDLSSGGGALLILIYIVIQILTLRSIVKVIMRKKEFDPYFNGIAVAWIAYQVQSIISINNLGLAVWGWIFSGCLIGYEINTRNSVGNKNSRTKGNSKNRIFKPRTQSEPIILVSIFLAFLSSGVLILPLVSSSAIFKSAIITADSKQIETALARFPEVPQNYLYAAHFFQVNSLDDEAINILKIATAKFPDYYDFWATLAKSPGISDEIQTQAKAQMKRLDPLNPNLK